jgi:hypothetical protein
LVWVLTVVEPVLGLVVTEVEVEDAGFGLVLVVVCCCISILLVSPEVVVVLLPAGVVVVTEVLEPVVGATVVVVVVALSSANTCTLTITQELAIRALASVDNFMASLASKNSRKHP